MSQTALFGSKADGRHAAFPAGVQDLNFSRRPVLWVTWQQVGLILTRVISPRGRCSSGMCILQHMQLPLTHLNLPRSFTPPYWLPFLCWHQRTPPSAWSVRDLRQLFHFGLESQIYLSLLTVMVYLTVREWRLWSVNNSKLRCFEINL